MRKLQVLLLTLLVSMSTLLVTPVMADEGGFYFEDYKIALQVHDDATIDVHIVANVNFTEQHHGLYFYIPSDVRIKREMSDGSYQKFYYYPSIDNVYVANYEYEVDDEYIKIGSEDSYVYGPVLYDVYYTYKMGDDKISDYDELYYSLIGSDWNTLFKNVEFDIAFDTMPTITTSEFYRGISGSTNNSVEYTVEGNHISGSATNLTNHQALTAWLRFPEGYYKNVEKESKGFIYGCIGVLGILTVLSFLGWLYKNHIRGYAHLNANSDAYLVKQIPSSDVGYIMDGIVDDRDLMSLIFWLASNRYITIDKDEKISKGEYDLPEDIGEHVKIIYEAVLAKKTSGKAMYEALNKARTALHRYYRKDRKLVSGTVGNFIMIAIVSIVLVTSYISLMYNANLGAMIVIGIVTGLFAFIAAIIVQSGMLSSVVNHTNGKGAFIGFVIVFVISTIAGIFFVNKQLYIWLIVINVIATLGYYFLSTTVNATKYWYDMAGNIQAFRDQILDIDLDTIQELMDENKTYYFDVVPYAYAFDLLDEWQDAFADYDFSTYESYYPYPYYYHTYFYNYVDTTSDNVSSYEASISSSSSSGGSSGGGFGGGGGGSW